MAKQRRPFCCRALPPSISNLALSCILNTALLILFLDFATVNGIDEFDPLVELQRPTSSSNSTTVLLHVNNFGAKGNGVDDDTEAFGKVWKFACASPFRAKIVVPDGKSFLVRPIDFAGPCKARVTLRISGSIVAPGNPDVWEGLDPNKWLYFHGIKYLTIEGGGTVDGNGFEWWARSCKINRTNPCTRAPKAMTFHRCQYLKMRNIMMVNSQQFHLSFTDCKQVEAFNLNIFAPAHSPNTDGIHLSESKNVEIKNCIIHTGDDCISIVGGSSRIRINGITCGPGHGISIGSLGKAGARDEVHDVKVNGAYLFNTENGVRIKTWQGGSGYASRITFSDIRMANVSNPILIDQYYCDSFEPCPNQTLAVNVANISYVGIKGTSATEEAITFACSDSSPCTGLLLKDIQLVSQTGEFTESFCWEAYGSSFGLVSPPTCLPFDGNIVQQEARSSSIQSV